MQLDDLKMHVRMLVVEYSIYGKDALAEMSETDRRLLLSEKQLQLARASALLPNNRVSDADLPLKTMLEYDVKEIGETLDRGLDRGR